LKLDVHTFILSILIDFRRFCNPLAIFSQDLKRPRPSPWTEDGTRDRLSSNRTFDSRDRINDVTQKRRMFSPIVWIAGDCRRQASIGISLLLVVMVFGCTLENSLIFQPSSELIATPNDVGLAYEDVTLATDDGVRINGWFVASAGADSTILWLHGNAGNISHRVDNIRKFHDRVPAHILIIDYRGYGRSEGTVSERGTYEDAHAAMAYLRARNDVDGDRIVLFGRSLGAAVALELALSTGPRALILESPFTSISAMARTVLPFLPIGPFLRTRYDNLKKIRALRVPLLVLHGDRDGIIPYRQGRELFDAAPEPKSFYTIAGAGHNDTYLVGGEPYFETIANFVARTN
jgi:fermentation-respiration switch protein FrsA (DUF1100 family)